MQPVFEEIVQGANTFRSVVDPPLFEKEDRDEKDMDRRGYHGIADGMHAD